MVGATLLSRNRSNTSTSGGCTVGPTSKVSFSETPVDDLADASNTARNFVVELDSLRTIIMHGKVENRLSWLLQICVWDSFCMLGIKVFLHDGLQVTKLSLDVKGTFKR